MVDTEAMVEQQLHLLVPRLTYLPTEKVPLWVLLTTEIIHNTFHKGGLFQIRGCFHSLFPSVNENHNLMTLRDQFGNLFKSDVIKILPRLGTPRFAFDT